MPDGSVDATSLTAPAKSPKPEEGFHCYICGERSEEICRRCTRDACPNHLCEKCGRCSDCCECDK